MTDLVVPKEAAPEPAQDNRQRRRENRKLAKQFVQDAVSYVVIGFCKDEGLKMVGDVGACRNENDLRHFFMRQVNEATQDTVNGFYTNVEHIAKEREQSAMVAAAKEQRSEELQGEG